jgi:hypothetical protein
VSGLLTLAAGLSGQVQTQTSVEHGPSTHEVKVQRGEVVYVEGNDLVVKMEDGQIRHIVVPDNVTATVDGKEVTVHDLKPGMKLERTITTTTTPKTVTTVKTVKGKVWQVSPPNSVILTLEDGTNKQFKIPKGQKFNIDGQEMDAWGLKKGMSVSATAITEVPQTVVAQEIKRTGQAPPPPATPPMESALLVENPAPSAEPAAAPKTETASAATPAAEPLPKTGSVLPLIGLLGVLFLGISFSMRHLRKA